MDKKQKLFLIASLILISLLALISTHYTLKPKNLSDLTSENINTPISVIAKINSSKFFKEKNYQLLTLLNLEETKTLSAIIFTNKLLIFNKTKNYLIEGKLQENLGKLQLNINKIEETLLT